MQGKIKYGFLYTWLLFMLFPIRMGGYAIVLTSDTGVAATAALLAMGVWITDMAENRQENMGFFRFSLIVAVLLSFKGIIYYGQENGISLLCMSLSTLCGMMLLVKFIKSKFFKWLCLLMSVVVVLGFFLLGILCILFNDFGEETVVQVIAEGSRTPYAPTC